jgi:hypothetical protein
LRARIFVGQTIRLDSDHHAPPSVILARNRFPCRVAVKSRGARPR